MGGVYIRCSVDVSVNWGRSDGTNIPVLSRIQYLDSGIRLQISELQRSDEGDYVCTGLVRGVGSTVFPVKLFVHG